MFSIVILICSMALDHSACQPGTAVDVVYGPKVANEIQCGRVGQLLTGPLAIAPRPGVEYAKIVCLRRREAANVRHSD